MAVPNPGWGWWGDAGGTRLDVLRLDNGRINFRVTTPDGWGEVILASFRVKQLRDWLNQPELLEGEPEPPYLAANPLYQPPSTESSKAEWEEHKQWTGHPPEPRTWA